MSNSSRVRAGRVVLLLLVFLLGIHFHKSYQKFNEKRRVEKVGGGWDKMELILSQLDAHYVDSINYSEITEEAIPFILQKLDPHSLYLSPKELKSADEQLNGNFDGIGIQFNVPNDTAVVINVIPGGPSERAGILSGDRLVEVDGEVVAGINMNQDSLVSRLRGVGGSLVNVGVKRIGVDKTINFEIKRDKIPVKSVDLSYMVNDTLGYIKLSKFSRSSYSEVMTALHKLSKEGVNTLIFDLRGNSGGYFDQALLLANEFLERGSLIVYMEGRHRKREDFYADNNGKYRELALKVLIDENSASSSEIFAGAIQDNDRGVIIGRRSYGKGLVQEPIYFSDNSGIRLTVARFYTPTGRSIQKPYGSQNYRDDILERYRDGEMLSADSIKFDPSLKYLTPSGRTLYGGGGITPDHFVPMDTTGVTPLFIRLTNLGLTFKFSSLMADKYRERLNEISSLESLNNFFNEEEFESAFLEYAVKNGVKIDREQWGESKKLLMSHIRAFIARYTPLDDDGFYPILLEIDNTFIKAVEL